MPDIKLNFIIKDSEVNGIFSLSVDNGESVKFLKNEVRTNQRNLNEFDLYKKNFEQANFALINTLKNPTNVDERLGQLMDPKQRISEYFRIDPNINHPYTQYDDERGPINVIIYYRCKLI